MTNPTEVNPFSTLPAEAWQHILTYVGNPPVTSRVSRAWSEQTQAVITRELHSVFHYLNPEKPFNSTDDLPAIQEVYRRTLQSVPRDIATHLPKVSLERFLEVEEVIKIRDTLTFWKRLPGGQTHLHQQNFDGLSSEDVGARLSAWIQQIPNVQAITALNLSNSNLRYLPPEIGQLTNLERLLFYLNQLTELPLEIGHLTNLQMLGLGENHLTELPPEIGRLTNLQWLYLNQIQLTAVPKTLSNIDVRISLSPECQCIKASIVYRFFQLSPEQKNAVYGHIYHLAIEAGGNIEPWDTQYGENHVFDSEERLEAAMRAVIT